MRRDVSSVLAVLAASFAALVACTGSDGGTPQTSTSDAGCSDDPTPVDAGCSITVDHVSLLPAQHVAIGTQVSYCSNPPSSGPHYPYWAAYKEYTTAVPRGFYVHDLEHGAIVFLYKCATANGCTDVVHALESASAAIPSDSICDQSQVRVRTLITPDPLLDVPIAAVAWGWTYKADCIDLPSLTSFALAHYGRGPEQLCDNGIDQF